MLKNRGNVDFNLWKENFFKRTKDLKWNWLWVAFYYKKKLKVFLMNSFICFNGFLFMKVRGYNEQAASFKSELIRKHFASPRSNDPQFFDSIIQ